jgi:hypothetical protein
MLKGRQTGGMHRGHAWVFRAESYDTMMAWFADIKELTEKSGKERDAFVRRSHARSVSGGSMKAQSIGGSSDGGLEEDEADAQPYSSEQSVRGASTASAAGQAPNQQYGRDMQSGEGIYSYGDERLDAAGWRPPQRPSPGGRFPSDLNVHRGLQAPLSPSSGESSTERDRDTIAAAGALPGSDMPLVQSEAKQQDSEHIAIHSGNENSAARTRAQNFSEEPSAGRNHAKQNQHGHLQQPTQRQKDISQSKDFHPQIQQEAQQTPSQFTADPNPGQEQCNYAAPATAAGVGGATVIGASALYQQKRHPAPPDQQQQRQPETVTHEMDTASAVPAPGTSSPPILTDTLTTTSPTTNPQPPSSSSQGDTGSLSTVPTSVSNSADASQQSQSQSQADTTTMHTARSDEDGNLPSKPVPLRTMTAGTISDLHIPGEYPKTPKFAP